MAIAASAIRISSWLMSTIVSHSLLSQRAYDLTKLVVFTERVYGFFARLRSSNTVKRSTDDKPISASCASSKD